MKALISNSENISISSIQDISALIPTSYTGKALNYGQGEGQFEIASTVWGIYANSNCCYELQYEEGSISIKALYQILTALEDKIKDIYGEKIQLMVQGMLDHYEPHEKNR